MPIERSRLIFLKQPDTLGVDPLAGARARTLFFSSGQRAIIACRLVSRERRRWIVWVGRLLRVQRGRNVVFRLRLFHAEASVCIFPKQAETCD